MSTGEIRVVAGSLGEPGYEGWNKGEEDDQIMSEDTEDIIEDEDLGEGSSGEAFPLNDFEGVYGTEAKFKQPSGVALTPDDKYAIVADEGDCVNTCQFWNA
jgi:hypothetical protein